jgi:hypothetical protein
MAMPLTPRIVITLLFSSSPTRLRSSATRSTGFSRAMSAAVIGASSASSACANAAASRQRQAKRLTM